MNKPDDNSPRFRDMLPGFKLNDARFMRMAKTIEQAMDRFEDDGGDWKEIPMLCAVIIVNEALGSDNPRQLVEATYQMMMTPINSLDEKLQ